MGQSTKDGTIEGRDAQQDRVAHRQPRRSDGQWFDAVDGAGARVASGPDGDPQPEFDPEAEYASDLSQEPGEDTPRDRPRGPRGARMIGGDGFVPMQTLDLGLDGLTRSLDAALELARSTTDARCAVLLLNPALVARTGVPVMPVQPGVAEVASSFPEAEEKESFNPMICHLGEVEADITALRDLAWNRLLDLADANLDHDARGLALQAEATEMHELGDPTPARALTRVLYLQDGQCAGMLALGYAPGNASADVSSDHPDDPPLVPFTPLTLADVERVADNLEFLLSTWWARLDLQRDLAASRSRALRLQRISEQDPLTGLENISTFEGKVRERLELKGEPGAFILIDVDHFKTVNDMYGHQFGDNYLKTVAQALLDTSRANAIVGRIGGDEFAVFADLPKMGESYLKSLMTMCRMTILRASAYLNKPDLGRVSIGAAVTPEHGDDYDTLYHRADLALYASKESGRSTATVYSEDVAERFDHAQLAKTFQAACRAGQVVPYFQPMVQLSTGETHAYEVLCRWENPRHGLLSPATFSSIFTDHGLATLLTRHIIQSSLQHFTRARLALDRQVKLSLNLTYFDLMDREFVFDFQAALSDFGVDWSAIIIEVQETVVMGEPSGQVFRTLEELRRRGAEIALDDFGMGYSGLRHLKSWPVDIVKIDKSFIRDLCTDYRDRAIVSSIVQLAKDLGFRVIAEGIENSEQAKRLQEMGCDMGQGFIYGRPLGPTGFATRLITD